MEDSWNNHNFFLCWYYFMFDATCSMFRQKAQIGFWMHGDELVH